MLYICLACSEYCSTKEQEVLQQCCHCSSEKVINLSKWRKRRVKLPPELQEFYESY